MLATIAVFDLVKDDLQRVETRLHDIPLRAEPDFELVTEAIGHVLDAGGKRIRPVLAIAAAEAAVGLAIVLAIFQTFKTIDVRAADLMRE